MNQAQERHSFLRTVPSLESVNLDLFLAQKLNLRCSSRIEFCLWTSVLPSFWIKETSFSTMGYCFPYQQLWDICWFKILTSDSHTDHFLFRCSRLKNTKRCLWSPLGCVEITQCSSGRGGLEGAPEKAALPPAVLVQLGPCGPRTAMP